MGLTGLAGEWGISFVFEYDGLSARRRVSGKLWTG
jgi:hypothetical protein